MMPAWKKKGEPLLPPETTALMSRSMLCAVLAMLKVRVAEPRCRLPLMMQLETPEPVTVTVPPNCSRPVVMSTVPPSMKFKPAIVFVSLLMSNKPPS